MTVNSVTQTTYSDVVEFNCVYGGNNNAEDNSFARATPSGGMKLTIDNPNVRGFYKPGMEVYVDISLVPDDRLSTPKAT